MISALSKDDLCVQHHKVSVYESESLDKAQALPFQNHQSIATEHGKMIKKNPTTTKIHTNFILHYVMT